MMKCVFVIIKSISKSTQLSRKRQNNNRFRLERFASPQVKTIPSNYLSTNGLIKDKTESMYSIDHSVDYPRLHAFKMLGFFFDWLPFYSGVLLFGDTWCYISKSCPNCWNTKQKNLILVALLLPVTVIMALIT